MMLPNLTSKKDVPRERCEARSREKFLKTVPFRRIIATVLKSAYGLIVI